MTAGLNRYMVDTITIARRTGNDSSGNPTFGSQFTAKARVEKGSRFVAGVNSNEIQFSDVVATETEIRTTDRVWLPGYDTSDDSVAKRPSDVRYARRRAGADGHYEAMF